MDEIHPNSISVDRVESRTKSVLGYWNTRALCEPIRLLLHYVEEDFTDVRYSVGPPPTYDKSSWTSVKYGDELNLTIPNLPYYIDIENGTTLTQTNTILMYIAEKYNLAGRSLQEKAYAHMLMEGLRDLAYDFFDVTYCDAPWCEGSEDVHIQGEDCCLSGVDEAPKYHAKKESYLAVTLPRHLTLYERILSSNRPQGQMTSNASRWLLGNDITYVDFILYEYLEQHLLFDAQCLTAFPHMLEFVRNMKNLPGVQRYITSADYKKEPIHNRYTHLYRANV